MKEQRRHSRLPTEIHVEWGKDSIGRTAIISNLSEEGLCLRIPKQEAPEIGDSVKLKVSLITSQGGYWIFSDPGAYVASIPREHTAYVRGEVRSVREDAGDYLIGIQLIDSPDGVDLGLIREYVHENI